MDLDIERTGDTAVVAMDPTPGDEAAVHELGAALDRLLLDPPRPRALVLDCAAIPYACSSLLGQLLRLRRKAVAADVALVLCGLNPNLTEVFKTTSLDRIFPVYADREAALAARAAGGAR